MSTISRRSVSQRSALIYDAHNFDIIIDTREIFISPNPDVGSDDAEINHMVANRFVKNIHILNGVNHNPIVIHLTTPGGIWEYGMTIYDAIKNSQAHVTTISYAHARSMSSIVPQAADKRIIMPSAYFLMHHGTLGVFGNYQNVVSDVKYCEEHITPMMMGIYTEKCQEGEFFLEKGWGNNPERIERYLLECMSKKQEFYLTAREAVEYGLMDAVFGDKGALSWDEIKTGV